MAFLIFNKSSEQLAPEKALALFSEMGFGTAVRYETNQYQLYHFDKILVEKPLYKITDDAALFCTGTLIYKGLGFQESLDTLFDDLINDTIEEQEFQGHFGIVWIKEDQINIRTDAANVQNLFYDTDQQVVSSSMLALVYTFKKSFRLDRKSVIENILTGSLVGPQTLLTDVLRFENTTDIEWPGFKIHSNKVPAPDKIRQIGNYQKTLSSQIAAVDNYFKKIIPFCKEFGIDTGLTSGLDSRLLFSFIKKHFDQYQTHSHFRKVKDKELQIAEQVAKQRNIPHVVEPVKHPLDMTPEQMTETLEQGFLFFDGHIRMHAFWMEEYNNRGLRERVLNSLQMGMSGIGGEQYRNNEGMLWPKWNMRNFIKYKVFENISGDSFTSKAKEDNIIDWHLEKTKSKLNISLRNWVDMYTVKRYFNEVFIPGRLGARNNAENKISFFLSPFVDWHLSFKAYEAIPHLGWSNQFEMDMVNANDPALAAIPSDYGYAFNQKVPSKVLLKAVVKEMIPYKTYQSRLDKKFNGKNSQYSTDLSSRHKVINQAIQTVKELNLPLKFSMLIARPDIMPLLINMGYFINRLRRDSRIDD